MYKSLRRISGILLLQCTQMFHIIAIEPILEMFVRSAHWPLQAGYPGLAITSLNEYVSLFSHCLVNILKYQGIEIIGIKSPVYLTRFDVAYLEVCDNPSTSFEMYKDEQTFRFFSGKIPPNSEQNCSTNYDQAVKYTNKSNHELWTCYAQFNFSSQTMTMLNK